MDASSVFGIVNAGIQGAGSSLVNRDMRKVNRLQRDQRQRQYGQQDRQLAGEQATLNRDANYAGEDIKSDANERGVLNSSIPQAAQQKLAFSHQQRYNAIQDQRNALYQDKMTEDEIYDYSRHADKLKHMFAMINAGIGGGASGMMNQYTGGAMSQGYNS